MSHLRKFVRIASFNRRIPVDLLILLLTFFLLEWIYAMPSFVSGLIGVSHVKELMFDVVFLFIACIPCWWLHFRKFPKLPLKKRVALHLLTVGIFYLIWWVAYFIYNPVTGRPLMTGCQTMQNLWHNLIFYIQAFCILHIHHYFKQREEQMHRELALQQQVTDTEIAGLRAQIQPHFLFNTLNSISASVPAQQEFTRDLIGKLADIFRYALQATQEDCVPLWKELDFIRTYLRLEEERFGSRLRTVIHMDEELADVPVPSMLFQPLVENALKHGIEPAIDGGVISILLTRTGQKLRISVSNTGKVQCRETDQMFSTGGVGLRNIAARLQRLYNEPIEVRRSQDYLEFSFTIPIPVSVAGSIPSSLVSVQLAH
ncbi:histidine kinase [Pseudoflavitalea sp. G-6-1-2]|uniref:sensor histidine kinase n=1 Tax=Pseudoflavitalea sp. G-6-1-2 TaxID=2728841 RepID=UPI00146C70C3|nr:histidine kinase [Pseudoflavitalea sp. G-6-1-2]NML22722.1 histidine kinase [Pseudoflavitalea sp. G-6-1-2]